jgi:predicted N-acyltransferase
MSVRERELTSIHCREDSILTPEEKQRFNGFFQEHGLTEDIFIFFESLVGLSTDSDRFVFVKTFAGDDLVGLAMFARIAGHSLYNSLTTELRQYAFLEKLGGMMRSTVYFSMHAVSSPGLPRSFLYTDGRFEDAVNEAILSWLREKRDADTVILFDSAEKSDLYARNSFTCLPFSSDSWLDVPRYETIDDYLALHKRTRKNLARFKKRNNVEVEILRGEVPEGTMRGIIECLMCSYQNSKGLLPIQDFFNANLLRTALFSSDRFIHFVIRVDGHVAGFSTRLLCGKNLIGIIGGYNRDLPGNLPVYDFMIVTTLDYCIRNGYTRLVYGVVDNHTKARLMDSFREQKFYFYARNPLLRLLLKHAYRFLSACDLYKIDAAAQEKRNATARPTSKRG